MFAQSKETNKSHKSQYKEQMTVVVYIGLS